jgi:hypothetical protein
MMTRRKIIPLKSHAQSKRGDILAAQPAIMEA